MRSPRFLFALSIAAATLAACGDNDGVVTETRPPLAGVRYLHASNSAGRLDFKMIDQVEYSANTNEGVGGLRFREASRYFSTEAGKPRRIRVFDLSDSSVTTVSNDLVATEITFEPNKNYTLLLVGDASQPKGSQNGLRLVRLEDMPAPEVNQIQFRMINASAAAADGWVGTAAPSGAPTFANVGALGVTNYLARATATATQTITVGAAAAGATTITATRAVDNGTAGTTTVNPIAGARVSGTAFSMVYFPASVQGSKAEKDLAGAALTAIRAPLTQVYVDRLPPNTVQ
jgi:hypothetical protein